MLEVKTMKSSVLVLILDTEVKSYQCLKKAQLSTWVTQAELRGYDVIYYRGASRILNYDSAQRTLYLPLDDSLNSSTLKLLEVLRYFYPRVCDYDYIFRTNLSSYIHIDRFCNFIDHLSHPILYGGVIGYANTPLIANTILGSQIINNLPFGNTIHFASGSGFILGTQYIPHLLEAMSDLRLIDDVAVGKAMNSYGVFPTYIPRIDIYDDFRHCDDLQIQISKDLDTIKKREVYHYRIKGKNKIKDASIFYLLDYCNGNLSNLF